MKKIILLSLLILTTIVLNAQEAFNISGVVNDSSGDPIPGASIIEEGTSNGTITNMDGQYHLKLSSANTKIKVSFIGFTSQTISINGRSTVNVSLAEEVTDLDEVVVVGYGEMRKSDLTGSVASLTVNNATESGSPSVDQLLQGRVSGVHVKTNSGVPGGSVQINIRGMGSMSASTQPLYVIDGMILDTDGGQDGEASTIGMTASNPISFLSPEDIERMEILKDASATAIYGSRGANGVVLITTKKGKKEGEISYSNSFAFAEVVKHIDMMNTSQYVNYRNEIDSLEWIADGELPADYIPVFAPTDTIKGIDWQKDKFRRAFSQKHRISFSKSDENSSMFMSGGYLSSDGVIDQTGFKKIDFRMNSSKNITDKLKLTANFNGSRLQNDMTVGTEILGGNRSMVGSIVFTKPIEDFTGDDGNYDPEEFVNSPDAWLSGHSDKSTEYAVVSKIGLNYKVNSNLALEGRLGTDFKRKDRKRYFGRGITRGETVGGLGENFSSQNFHWVSDFLVKYNRKFGKHRVNTTLGFTADQKFQEQVYLSGTQFMNDVLEADALHSANIKDIGYTRQYKINYGSGLFRINYSYKGKINATITGRQDYSNKLTKGKNSAFFPSFAAAYRLSEESFIKQYDFVSNLKLRAGWGQVGNSGLPPYATRFTTGFSTSSTMDGSPITSLGLSQYGNDVTWEISEQTNVGLDLGLFNNRISVTVDAYDKRTRNQLQKIFLPLTAGYNYVWDNLGEVQNRGVEFSVNANLVNSGGFTFDLGGNISFNRNKIIDLGDLEYFGSKLGNNAEIKNPVNIFREGEAVGVFYGYKTDGILQTEEEALAHPSFGGEYLPEGNTKFVNLVDDVATEDINGNGVVDEDEKVINDLDKTIIGNPNPDFVYGIYGNVGYKGLGLSFLINGVQGRDVFNGNYGRLRLFHITGTNKLADAYQQAWRPDAPSNKYPRIDYQQNAFSSVYTDQWVEDASFIRLSNVTLSYLVKPNIDLIKSAKFYVTGTNLLTLTNYKGFDPEVDSYPNDPTKVGIDLNSFPAVQTILFGVNVVF